MTADLVTDIAPEINKPRVRMRFSNGWVASLIFYTDDSGDGFITSVAAVSPKGEVEIIQTEATNDEVADLIAEIKCRKAFFLTTDGDLK